MESPRQTTANEPGHHQGQENNEMDEEMEMGQDNLRTLDVLDKDTSPPLTKIEEKSYFSICQH